MDKFEQKEMIKRRPLAKNNWYIWYNRLINYIPKPIKTASGVKVMSLFITNTIKDYNKCQENRKEIIKQVKYEIL